MPDAGGIVDNTTPEGDDNGANAHDDEYDEDDNNDYGMVTRAMMAANEILKTGTTETMLLTKMGNTK